MDKDITELTKQYESIKWTELHCALEFEMNELLPDLCTNQDVNSQDIYERTSLCIAAAKGNIEILKLLIENGALKELGSPLYYAIQKGNSDCFHELLSDTVSNIKMKLSNYTPLMLSVLKNEESFVTALLNHKADVNYGSETALHLACETGHMKCLEELIKFGADVNKQSKYNKSPLDYAITNKKLDVIKVLLKNNASVDNIDVNKETSVYTAVMEDNIDVLKEIVPYSSNINLQDNDGATPLLLSVLSINSTNNITAEILTYLIENNAETNICDYNSFSPIHLVALSGNLNCLQILIEGGANINAVTMNNATPLYLAAAKGHFEICKELLDNGAYTNIAVNKFDYFLSYFEIETANFFLMKNGKTASEIATLRKHDNISELIESYDSTYNNEVIEWAKLNLIENLLENIDNIDLNQTDLLGWSCLHHAVDCESLDFIIECINNSVNINQKDLYGRTPLTIATGNGNLSIVKLLLENGADVNTGDSLFYSIKHNSLNCLDELIINNADLNIIDKRGKTPLMYAISESYDIIANKLVESGADITLSDEDNNTALHLASQKCLISTVEKLLEFGMNVNVQNIYKETPLFIAVTYNYKSVVDVLLLNNADVMIPDRFYETPLHTAASGLCTYTVEQLILNGSNVNASNDENITPLFETIGNNFDNFKLLIENGADVNHCNSIGWTALHLCAAADNEIEYAEVLLENNANVNALNIENITPLHLAVIKNNEEMVKLLLKHNCNINIPVNNLQIMNSFVFYHLHQIQFNCGDTPMLVAQNKGFDNIVALLEGACC